MFGLGGLMGGMGGLGGMMGGAAGGAAGAAGGAAAGAGGFMGTLGKIGKGLGTAAQTFSSMGGFTGEGQQGGGARTPGGWNGGQDTSLQDEVKKQLEMLKQEQVMRDLMRYQPLEDRGGISGLTVNPYK
jgi:hypothetical protein